MTGFCSIPHSPPAWAYTCACICGDGYQKQDDAKTCGNLPDYCNVRPVVMRKNTLISDPVLAFPVRLDHLVAAAFAIKKAKSSMSPEGGGSMTDDALQDLLKPHIESIYKDEPSEVRTLSEGSGNGDKEEDKEIDPDDENDENDEDNGNEEEDGDDEDNENIDDGEEYEPVLDLNGRQFEGARTLDEDGPAGDRARRGMDDIQNYREIHDAFHAAQLSADSDWLAARHGDFEEYEDTFHSAHCKVRDLENNDKPASRRYPHVNGTQKQWSLYNTRNETEDLRDRRGCRTFDQDYWEKLATEYDEIGGTNEDYWQEMAHEHECDVKVIRDVLEWEQRCRELESWRDRIGLNGNNQWIQENVIDVFQNAFPDIHITIINARVMENNVTKDEIKINKEEPVVCSFFPMAWIHLETKWKCQTNETLTGGAHVFRESYDEDKGEKGEEDDDDDDDDDDEENDGYESDGARETRCMQGYKSSIPSDPYHWYSNAARAFDNGINTRTKTAAQKPLLRVTHACSLEQWLHPFQYLHPDHEALYTKAVAENPNWGHLHTAKHCKEMSLKSKEKEWPAMVVLRKTTGGDLSVQEKPNDGDDDSKEGTDKPGKKDDDDQLPPEPKRKRDSPETSEDEPDSTSESQPSKKVKVAATEGEVAPKTKAESKSKSAVKPKVASPDTKDALRARAAPKSKCGPKAEGGLKAKAARKEKTAAKGKAAAPTAKAATAKDIAPKAKAAAKSKVTPRVQATPKSKTSLKEEPASKADDEPKTRTAPRGRPKKSKK